jgi:DNA-binding response OmpR family regulator
LISLCAGLRSIQGAPSSYKDSNVLMTDEGTSMPQVLVAEDQGAIGIALEDALADEGYTVAGPFASRSSACAWLEVNTPDLALLDLLLRDGPCVELARTLRRRDVPVVFFSGFTPAEGSLPLDLQDLPWIEKPISFGL